MAGIDRSSILNLFASEDKADNDLKFQIDTKTAGIEFKAAGAAQKVQFDASAYEFKKAGTYYDLEGRFDSLETDAGVATNSAAITALQVALASEITDRTALDVTHGINQTAELNARVAADLAIQNDVNANEADADTAIALVQTNLNTEAAARATAVSAEAATRAAAVTSLQSQITNILSDATPQVLDDLASIVSHFTSADSTLTSNVAASLVRIAAIEAAVNAALGQSLGP
jgi:hypothetical protein